MFRKMNLINFSAYWKKNRTSIIACVILMLTYVGFLHACDVAYDRLGVLNFTQYHCCPNVFTATYHRLLFYSPLRPLCDLSI